MLVKRPKPWVLKRLLNNVDVSFMLSDYNVTKSGLPKLVKGGMAQSRCFGVNPRDLTEKDVEGIYEKMFGA